MRYIIFLIRLIIICLVLSIVIGGLYIFLMRARIPSEYESGKKADDLARQVQSTLHRAAWAKTGAIRWSLLNNQHLWDLRRGLVRTRFSDQVGQNEVLFDVDFKRYQVKTKAHQGPKASRWVQFKEGEGLEIAEAAYELWFRDRLILEPSHSLFDSGVERYLVTGGTEKQPTQDLMVHFRKGGKHPGDTFLWHLSPEGVPTGIRFWSDQFYVSGLEMKMDKWRILKSGLQISTHRKIGPIEIDIKVNADMSLTHLLGPVDPFKAIEGDPFDPPPTSQPNILPNQKTAY
jgi:hypothetical protein